jgi:hypothetical protein
LEKAEAGQISRAIDVLRDAPNPQKSALLAALRGVSCAAADLCELKRLCVAGYSQHVAGLNQTALAKSLLSTAGSDADAAQVLNAASAELARAAPQISACADAQGAAHRKYKF